MSSDNASSAVTYTSISSDSNGPSWGIPLVNAGELSEMDPYEEVAQQGQAPPLSPAYVPDPMELDEHVPVYVPEPEHPEYHVPSDDDIQVEDQPYADDASPTAESPGYIADSDSMEEDSIDYPDEPEDDDEDPEEDDDEDPEEDPSEEHEPEDDDEDPEEDPSEEHEPEDEDTGEDKTAVTPPPPPRHRGARISVRPQTPMAASTQALINAFAAESPLFPLPPTSPAYDQAPLCHRAAMIHMRDDIPEEDMPPQRNLTGFNSQTCFLSIGYDFIFDEVTLVSYQYRFTGGRVRTYTQLHKTPQDNDRKDIRPSIIEENPNQAKNDLAIQRNSTRTQKMPPKLGGGPRRPVQPARVCSYTDFMKCQPLNFKGTEGVVGLSQWLEKMESVSTLAVVPLTIK
ncbi:hypothetical protein Tco_0167262 [Tanacetum coccineum]